MNEFGHGSRRIYITCQDVTLDNIVLFARLGNRYSRLNGTVSRVLSPRSIELWD